MFCGLIAALTAIFSLLSAMPSVEAATGRLCSFGGADITRNGLFLAVRTDTTAYVYDLRRGIVKPIVIRLLRTKQGEAIAWSPDGQSFSTSSEGSGLWANPASGVVDRYAVPKRS